MAVEGREFRFTDKNFAHIQSLAYETTGIKLSAHKRNMVYGRLSRRLRRLGMESFDEYCHLIDDRSGGEFTEFINSITTNLTSFFRENYHFEFLKNTVLPDLVKTKKDKRLRAWSAGCSTGEEPYSIAITIADTVNRLGWDAKILATDLDSNVIEKGKSAVYSEDRIESLPESIKRAGFNRQKSNNLVQVKPRFCRLITFKQLNLLNQWPMKGPFDFIFCRNVVIYFDKDTQRVLFDKMADMLVMGGYLFIGHSESLHRVSNRFSSKGRTIYQRTS